jgi:hypothetical protein
MLVFAKKMLSQSAVREAALLFSLLSKSTVDCVPYASYGHATQPGLRPSPHRLFVEPKRDQIKSRFAIWLHEEHHPLCSNLSMRLRRPQPLRSASATSAATKAPARITTVLKVLFPMRGNVDELDDDYSCRSRVAFCELEHRIFAERESQGGMNSASTMTVAEKNQTSPMTKKYIPRDMIASVVPDAILPA